MATATKKTPDELTTLKVADIVVQEDHNVRSTMDAEQLEQLVASIKQHGVLQPVVVSKSEDGQYTLVAGHRRVAAAKKARVKEVPATVRADVNGDAGALMVVENLLREDLNPIDQARGFQAIMDAEKLSQAKLAARINVSPSVVSERLRLLKLPNLVQESVKIGTVPLSLTSMLGEIAKQSPAFAAHVSHRFVVDDLEAYHVLEDADRLQELFDDVVEKAAEAEDYGPLGTVFDCDRSIWEQVDQIDWPEDRIDLRKRVEKESSGYNGIRFDGADVDAARAFGCLFEYEVNTKYYGGTFRFVFDTTWLIDRLEQKVVQAEKQKEKAAAATVTPSGSSDGGKNAEPDDSAEARKKAEREAAAQKKIAAQARNEEFGSKLARALHEPKITVERMRLLAHMILCDNSQVAGAGLAFCDERLMTKTQQKNGKTKVELMSPTGALDHLRGKINAAKKPEQVMGLILQALVAGKHADQDSVAQSNRVYWHVPGGYGTAAEDNPSTYIDREAVEILPATEADKLREQLAGK